MTDLSKIIVTKVDVKSVNFCKTGTHEWLRLNGFSSRDMHDGIPADRMIATGCSLGAAVVAAAIERYERQNDEVTDDGR
ncbi:hypothetical protein TW83_10010 [Paracoccus sp. S4493]|uniref:hypothetical protein n=1 Tax=Paracoccus sp. S4493 TaxID=579490 RepID=UPI0005FA4E8F|nr:hypothetical protein [Paracoccus sp. S4493]KJZ31247.1 hypothetical protein TW83_10010 [Paracoccus sp. S4493]